MIVYEDEASFRQTPTLARTWARKGCQPRIPTLGQRNTQKVLGAVSVPAGRFAWRHQTEYFNAGTYVSFLEEVLLPAFYRQGHRIYLVEDNASYHKKPEVWDWVRAHRRQIEVFLRPPYSPEYNATERLWHYTRTQSTHNRFFNLPEELCESLFTTFREMERCPQTIQGFLVPYF